MRNAFLQWGHLGSTKSTRLVSQDISRQTSMKVGLLASVQAGVNSRKPPLRSRGEHPRGVAKQRHTGGP